MELKNAINILFAKFGLNYRVLVYLFIVFTIVLAICVSIIIPSFTAVFDSPQTAEMFQELRSEVGNFVSGGTSFNELSSVLNDIGVRFADLWSSTDAPVVFWITFTVMLLILRFASSFCFPVIIDIVNNFMSSNMKYGFLSNMLKNFKLCFKYAFYHTIFSSIIDGVIILTVIGIISALLPLINVFALMIGLIAAILLISLRLTISSGILPEMLVSGETNYFRAIVKSNKYVKKYGPRMFGAYCITTFSLYCLLMLLTIITFGVAFFVLSAMFIVIVHILQLVFYYGGKNMRYYTDGYTIVNTAPIENRLDLQEELLPKDEV